MGRFLVTNCIFVAELRFQIKKSAFKDFFSGGLKHFLLYIAGKRRGFKEGMALAILPIKYNMLITHIHITLPRLVAQRSLITTTPAKISPFPFCFVSFRFLSFRFCSFSFPQPTPHIKTTAYHQGLFFHPHHLQLTISPLHLPIRSVGHATT